MVDVLTQIRVVQWVNCELHLDIDRVFQLWGQVPHHHALNMAEATLRTRRETKLKPASY